MSSNAVAALAEAVAATGGPTPALAELCAAVAVSNDGGAEAEWRQVFPTETRSLAGAARAANLDTASGADAAWRALARQCVYAAAQLGTPTLASLLSAGRVAGRLLNGCIPLPVAGTGHQFWQHQQYPQPQHNDQGQRQPDQALPAGPVCGRRDACIRWP